MIHVLILTLNSVSPSVQHEKPSVFELREVQALFSPLLFCTPQLLLEI